MQVISYGQKLSRDVTRLVEQMQMVTSHLKLEHLVIQLYLHQQNQNLLVELMTMH